MNKTTQLFQHGETSERGDDDGRDGGSTNHHLPFAAPASRVARDPEARGHLHGSEGRNGGENPVVGVEQQPVAEEHAARAPEDGEEERGRELRNAVADQDTPQLRRIVARGADRVVLGCCGWVWHLDGEAIHRVLWLLLGC